MWENVELLNVDPVVHIVTTVFSRDDTTRRVLFTVYKASQYCSETVERVLRDVRRRCSVTPPEDAIESIHHCHVTTTLAIDTCRHVQFCTKFG